MKRIIMLLSVVALMVFAFNAFALEAGDCAEPNEKTQEMCIFEGCHDGLDANGAPSDDCNEIICSYQDHCQTFQIKYHADSISSGVCGVALGTSIEDISKIDKKESFDADICSVSDELSAMVLPNTEPPEWALVLAKIRGMRAKLNSASAMVGLHKANKSIYSEMNRVALQGQVMQLDIQLEKLENVARLYTIVGPGIFVD